MKKCELRNRAVLCINGSFAPDFVVRYILVRFQIAVTREYSNLYVSKINCAGAMT